MTTLDALHRVRSAVWSCAGAGLAVLLRLLVRAALRIQGDAPAGAAGGTG